MMRLAKPALAAFALLLSCALQAQTFKCTDAYGKITYSGKACKELGLKDAGEVKDRLNINPAIQPAGTSDRPAKAPAPAPAPVQAAPPAEAPAEEPAPNRRCFAVSTPKGTVTRCNDTPPE